MSGALRGLRVFLRLIVAMLVFAIEVRVHAKLEEPEDCWRTDKPCAVQTRGQEKLALQMKEGEIVLDELTTVVRLQDGKLRLVSGTIWLRGEGELRVDSEFGEFSVNKGEFWVRRTRDRVIGSAVVNTLTMKPRSREKSGGGLAEGLEIAPGLENWLGRVRPGEGRAQNGAPMAISLREHFVRWARLYSGGREKFLKEAEEFYGVWLKATEQAAEIHRELVVRKMASLSEDHVRELESKRKVEERNRELVEIFRRKVFDP